MMILDNTRTSTLNSPYERRPNERGVALATTLIVIALMAIISVSVLAVVSNEAGIAGSDLQRTQTYDAAAAGIEKMTSDFSAVFERKSKPATSDLTTIQNAYPSELLADGFKFNQTLVENATALAAMRAAQVPAITNNTTYPRVTIPTGPFAGLIATVSPYQLTTTAIHTAGSTQVTLQRDMNNYLIPLFQFGMFSDGDIEVHPGASFFFNGRIHANGNIYATGIATFLDKITVGNELVRTVLRNGNNFTNSGNVNVQVGSIVVPMTVGSVTGGPNLPGKSAGQRGFFPDAPNGTDNTNWKTNSVAAAQTGIANQFGGQVLTRTTGAVPLYLPLQLGGNPTREIIKRQMPGESDSAATNYDQVLNDSRYHSKAQIRILLDDEGQTQASNKAAIPDGKGVELSQTVTTNAYYFKPQLLGGGNALWRIGDNGAYIDTATTTPLQCPNPTGTCTNPADTVRGVKVTAETSYNNSSIAIPAGAGIKGRILIEIVPSNGGASIDVTKEILSMGMTEGEPNAIVQLQRPLWAAFTQGSRDRSGLSNTVNGISYTNSLIDIINSTSIGADGEVDVITAGKIPTMDATYGYLTNLNDETGTPRRLDAPAASTATFPARWNSIVPINVYNVREGWLRGNMTNTTIYERGVTSIVELNMKNLARWVDGVYDTNLLAGTNAVSANIDGSIANGYIVYVSDRRGDKVKSEYASYDETTGAPVGAAIQTTNGMVDNEDIYGPNGTNGGIPEGGEDVIDFGIDIATGSAKKGSLQRDISELPDPAALTALTPPSPLPASFTNATRFTNALTVASWQNPTNYFRRAVRLFNGEDLLTQPAGVNKLSSTHGLTVSTENMVYIWGNYNTTGITCQPGGSTPTGSTLNDPIKTCTYTGDQVPASIVSDAFFPLSKTWFDASSALFPESSTMRPADAGAVADGTQSTSVRAGIIAGNTLSAMAGTPDADNGNESRLSGGMHNFPRFSENWSNNRWNFVGALAPLYRSTQALAPYHTGNGEIYGAPIRNWAFDDSFRDPNRLPPGTPTFQYIEPTGFRQLLN